MDQLIVGTIDASFVDIELDFGLKVDSFKVMGQGAQILVKTGQLILPNPGTVEAVVSEASVAALLARKAPGGLKDFEVKIGGGLIEVNAKAQIVVSIPIKARCTLEIDQGKRLLVRLKEVDVMGGAARNLVESQMDKINPIFDAGDLPIDVELTSVDCDHGRIVIHGQVRGS